MRTNPILAVGIVTYNSLPTIDACLRSLLPQLPEHSELIVWDNASPDETANYITQHYPNLPLRASRANLGFGPAHNHILHATTAPYYLLLNPDVVLDSNFLQRTLEAIATPFDTPSSGISALPGAVNGLVCYLENGHPTHRIYSCGHQLFRDRRVEDMGIGQSCELYQPPSGPLFGFNGACALLRRQALDQVSYPEGPFDPRYFLYGEDDDLNWRLALAGWRTTHTPRALAWHAAGSSGAFLDPKARKDAIANRWLTILKNDHPALFLRDLPWILSLELAYWGLRSLRRPAFLLDLVGAIGKFLQNVPSTLRLRKAYPPALNLAQQNTIIERKMLPRLRTLLGRSHPRTRHHSAWSRIEK